MKYDEVIEHYGTAYRAAKKNEFSTSTVYKWKEIGFVPIHAQMKIEKETEGKLKASLEHCLRNI